MRLPIIDTISQFIPYKLLDLVAGTKVLPVFYHAVGYKNELPYLNSLYRIPDPREFESDLDFILREYTPLNLEELISYKNTGNLPGNKKYFFLSFDDGLSLVNSQIAPILLRKGIPATFFINTGFAGNENFLHRFKTLMLHDEVFNHGKDIDLTDMENFSGRLFSDNREFATYIKNLRYPQRHLIEDLIAALNSPVNEQLIQLKPYLTKEEISELILQGFTIGAHSVSHPEFYLISEEEQLEQTCNSIEQISEWFSPNYKVFAFPFTDNGVTNSFFAKLNERCHPDLTFGCAGLKHDTISNHIQRISMDDSDLSAQNRLKSEFLYYCLKRPLGKNYMRRN